MDATYREYRKTDFKSCEKLVNQAWRFDTLFNSAQLGELAAYMYAKSAVLGSNFAYVVEVKGEVVGFLFGVNKLAAKPRMNVFSKVKLMWKLIRHRSAEKPLLINAAIIHEKNRTEILARDKSEISLFVVDKKHQGQGVGSHLWQLFSDDCKRHGANSIIVETNHLGAVSFYQQLGFELLADFDSPLHEIATKGGRACMLECLL